MIGRTLSHYKILEEISRGGMGIIYRALDLNLDREVALKVLPPELVADAERKRRFIQEAKAAAKLEHPHIGVVHEIDEADGVTFIAMELIRGEKLADVLKKERFPLARSLELAMEVAEALSCAHEKGIVHRDLKPANIMLTEQDHAKIIDFGLAKLTEPLVSGDSEAETAVKGETHPGQVMGTADYMSPEQAAGQKVDHRSDIFSFGVVFHEMMSGQPPFKGVTSADTLGAILRDPAPKISGLDIEPGQMGALQFVLDKCLAKKPEERYRATDDLLFDLKRVKDDLVGARAQSAPPTTRHKVKYAWLAAGIVLLLALGYFLLSRPGDREIRFINPVQLTSDSGVEDYPTWSPDGGRIAYQSNQRDTWDIWVTQVKGGSTINVTSEDEGSDSRPAWSPDGTQIAFNSTREGGGYFVMSALGGGFRKVLSAASRGDNAPQWSGDGTKVAGHIGGSQDSVEVVEIQTRESRIIPLPGRNVLRANLAWSPDERFFAYIDATSSTPDVSQIWLMRLSDGEAYPVSDGLYSYWSPSWSQDGRTLFFVSNRGGMTDLWVQRLEEDGTLEGSPEQLTSGIGMRSAVFSPDGTKLAYSRGRRVANVWRIPILEDRVATWADAEAVTSDHAFIEFVDVSPDGKHLLVASDRSGNQDIWMLPVDGGDMKQITIAPTPDWNPRWSPDGNEIAFYAYRSGNRDIWAMPLSGGPVRQLTEESYPDLMPSWSPDGRWIAYGSMRSGTYQIFMVSAAGGDPRQLTSGSWPQWSNDGEWLYFTSRRPDAVSRIWRVRVDGGEAEQVSRGPASGLIRWSGDGKELYFAGSRERVDNVWSLSLDDGTERPLTDLRGKPGRIFTWSLATYGDYLYFTWGEDLGDIWVMDVVYE